MGRPRDGAAEVALTHPVGLSFQNPELLKWW